MAPGRAGEHVALAVPQHRLGHLRPPCLRLGDARAHLMLPGADCFVFDHRVVRWNFQRGDGTNPRHYTFSSDPRTIRDTTAAFEMAWDRATPHAEYKTD